MRPRFDVCLITPELPAQELTAKVARALSAAPAGRVGLQLRALHLSAQDRRELALVLRDVARHAGVPFLVNGDLALAGELGADGVQLPERGPRVREARALLGDGALIGASRHDRAGLLAAEAEGADFALLSPIFRVAGKNEPLGLRAFGDHVGAVRLPVFALGGVTAERAAAAISAGAAGVAVMREVLAAEQPDVALRRLLAAIHASRLEL